MFRGFLVIGLHMLLLGKLCHLSTGTTTSAGTSSLHHLVLVNNVLLLTGTMMERGERLSSDGGMSQLLRLMAPSPSHLSEVAEDYAHLARTLSALSAIVEWGCSIRLAANPADKSLLKGYFLGGKHNQVIESSYQEGRSSNTGIRTPGAPVDSVELVTMLAGSREWASLPARHGVVPAASEVMGHIGLPAGNGNVTPLGAGPPGKPSAGTATHLPTHSHPPDAGSHHRATGSQERGKRALAFPDSPAAAERTPPGLETVSTDLAEGTQGGHPGTLNMLGFNNTMRTVLLPSSSESHHPGEPPQFILGTLSKCSNTWEQSAVTQLRIG
ncbi:hypothetical protein BTVI_26542 [Pitangus sulphuratus]|nr:hypothetical protein BTVI_26542 [Pitangus sulphuratus]